MGRPPAMNTVCLVGAMKPDVRIRQTTVDWQDWLVDYMRLFPGIQKRRRHTKCLEVKFQLRLALQQACTYKSRTSNSYPHTLEQTRAPIPLAHGPLMSSPSSV